MNDPAGATVFVVCDAFISKGFYKPRFSHKNAKVIIPESEGCHFNPDEVNVFCRVKTEFYHITRDFTDSDEAPVALGEM